MFLNKSRLQLFQRWPCSKASTGLGTLGTFFVEDTIYIWSGIGRDKSDRWFQLFLFFGGGEGVYGGMGLSLVGETRVVLDLVVLGVVLGGGRCISLLCGGVSCPRGPASAR